ncbi:MAG: DUF2156 domain-containing protein [Acidimicrobiia bacterium]
MPGPIFPHFKPLDPSDRPSIERLTARFLPYSDYSFVSLLSWSAAGRIEWSVLRENLAVRFDGYVAGDVPFYSMLGANEIDATVAELIDFSGRAPVDGALKLVPEVVVEEISDRSPYVIDEDPDNHDYVFKTSDLAGCRGARFEAKRKRINRFLRAYGHDTRVEGIDLADRRIEREVLAVFSAWEQSRLLDRRQTADELDAVRTLLTNAAHLDLNGIGVMIDGQLSAFSIFEVVDDFAIAHFEKADVAYQGLFQFLKQQVAISLRDRGCEFVNYEQDLGLPGIRREKRSWHPATYLKKYVISALGQR